MVYFKNVLFFSFFLSEGKENENTRLRHKDSFSIEKQFFFSIFLLKEIKLDLIKETQCQ